MPMLSDPLLSSPARPPASQPSLLYTLWGADQPDTGAVPKLFFLAGRENGLGWDFDAFDLLAGKHGPDAWAHVVAWLERGD